jgi:hypothetical protein
MAAADALHPALAVADIMLPLCGVGFAIRHAANRDDPSLLRSLPKRPSRRCPHSSRRLRTSRDRAG